LQAFLFCLFILTHFIINLAARKIMRRMPLPSNGLSANAAATAFARHFAPDGARLNRLGGAGSNLFYYSTSAFRLIRGGKLKY
jgi:hypothetical protein